MNTKTRKARTPKAPSRIAVATAYTRGCTKHVVRKHPKTVGFAAGAAVVLGIMGALS
jgi:ElaB/YqjD/DUF883 family membrane-anchored ribosome-binding protein